MTYLTDPTIHQYLIGGMFVLAGVLHFIFPKVYMRIMPDYIPWHKAMVYLSGVGEILGGAGMMISLLREVASWGLILLLLAVFPANIEMFRKAYRRKGFTRYTSLLLLRLPLQFALIYWVYWAGLLH